MPPPARSRRDLQGGGLACLLSLAPSPWPRLSVSPKLSQAGARPSSLACSASRGLTPSPGSERSCLLSPSPRPPLSLRGPAAAPQHTSARRGPGGQHTPRRQLGELQTRQWGPLPGGSGEGGGPPPRSKGPASLVPLSALASPLMHVSETQHPQGGDRGHLSASRVTFLPGRRHRNKP